MKLYIYNIYKRELVVYFFLYIKCWLHYFFIQTIPEEDEI